MAPPPQAVEVRHDASVGEARRVARIIAAALGFAPQSCDEIALAATELASNVLKRAHGGTLALPRFSP